MNSMLALGAIYLTFVLGLIVICFMGDPEEDGWLGYLSRLLTRTVPKYLKRVLIKVPGGRFLLKGLERTFDYVVNKPNPLLQIVYLCLVIGGFLSFVHEAFPAIPNQYLGTTHLYTSHLAVVITLLTFLKASSANPGVVNEESLAMHDHFPYDGFVYVRQECITCKVRKTARSKHCSICQVCVSKFDHHCPWINNCVGEANYRWFLLFLFSTMSLIIYAAIGTGLVLLDFVQVNKLLTRQFMDKTTGQKIGPSYQIVATFLFMRKGILVMLFILAVVMGIVVSGFFVYHLYLAGTNFTTNESAKWSGIHSFYKTEAKMRAEFPEEYNNDKVDETDFFNPDIAPPLSQREVHQFPRECPKHIYSHGLRGNYMEVLFPKCYRKAEKPSPRSKAIAVKHEKKKTK